METDEIKKLASADFKSNLFLILIVIFICILLFTIMIFVKNKDVIISDPIAYGINIHNFSSCFCLDSQGNFLEFTKNGIANNSG